MRRLFASIALTALLAATFSMGSAMATDQPAYSVVRELGPDVEVRDYASMILAEVDVEAASAGRANNDAFQVLAGYIFGRNAPSERIGMTSPVQQKPRNGENIGMTSPVGQTPRDGGWTTSFVMPGRYTMDNLPRPLDPSIRIREVPAQRVAAIRFSGRASPVRFAEQRELLMRDVAKAGLVAEGDPWTAQYNPPWTPGFMRRNEVLVALREDG